MNIFIIGLPKSGRTTIAKSLSEIEGAYYIDASSWIKHTFRDQKENESLTTYQDEFFDYLSNRLMIKPNLYVDNVEDTINAIFVDHYNVDKKIFIIDGINSPHDLVKLFNYNEDYIVFVNRTDNDAEFKDHENIGVSVIRDYCYWMSSINLLPKERWLEFNYKIHGEESDKIKILGSKNSVYIVKNIQRGISLLKDLLIEKR